MLFLGKKEKEGETKESVCTEKEQEAGINIRILY